mgnify:CR=1 FL=1
MSWKTAVVARLLNAAPIASAVATRINWTRRPQGETLPSIVVETITDPRPQTMDGPDSIRASRIRVHCNAATEADADALAEPVIAALTPAGSFGGVWFDNSYVDQVRPTGGDTDDGFIHRTSIDFIIWHKG